MASTHICPICGGRRFSTPVHVMQDWEVDEDGEYISCLEDNMQVSFPPNDDNIWSCMECETGEGVIVPDEFATDTDLLSKAFALLRTKSLDDVSKELSLSKNLSNWIKKVHKKGN